MKNEVLIRLNKFLNNEIQYIKPHTYFINGGIREEEYFDWISEVLVRKNKVFFMYLDHNEYSGKALRKEKELKFFSKTSSEKSFHPLVEFSLHKTLSLPIFITGKKIIDVPDFVTEEKMMPIWAFNYNDSNQNLMNCNPGLMENNSSKYNELGKSSWMKDVELGNLF